VDALSFVEELATAEIGETFNQYGRGARAALLRERLAAYLARRSDARVILVGEAPGYRGARISGLPFTSERQLTGEGPAEATATVVQRVLRELGVAGDVLLWNVVPTHPGGERSNRRPTRSEIEGGLVFVRRLARGRRVLAVGRVAERALGAPYVRHPSHGGASAFRDALVRQALGAELAESPPALRQPGQTHAGQDAIGLRELDLAIVDDLPVVSPRVAEVVATQELGTRGSCRLERRLAIVHDHADVPGLVRRLRPALGEGDELVADVDEGRPSHPPAELEVEDATEELERRVDAVDLDRDVVDPDEAGHAPDRTACGTIRRRRTGVRSFFVT
jgi:uracil-DNA glycosylase